jgi:hypothetical protein
MLRLLKANTSAKSFQVLRLMRRSFLPSSTGKCSSDQFSQRFRQRAVGELVMDIDQVIGVAEEIPGRAAGLDQAVDA